MYDTLTDRQTDRQTNRRMNRRTDRQLDDKQAYDSMGKQVLIITMQHMLFHDETVYDYRKGINIQHTHAHTHTHTHTHTHKQTL